MDSFWENILLKLTPTEIGNHIKTYLSLYMHPYQSWKRSISNRKDSFNYIILHLIYYTVLLFIALQNIFTAIQLVIVEAIITLIPLSIFIAPFLLFTNIYNKKLHWSKLYRLILVIKLQFIPLFFILLSIAKKGNIEPLYLIIDNLIWIVWLVIIIIIPVIIKLKVWQKAVWIFTNYISFLIGIFLVVIVLNQFIEGNKYIEGYIYISPSTEYNLFQNKSSFFNQKIQDDKYLLVITKNNTNYNSESRYVTNELLLEFIKNSIDRNIIDIYKYDSIKAMRTSTKVQHNLKFKRDSTLEILTSQRLDSFNIDITNDFNTELNLLLKMKDSVRYKSNKEYFRTYYEYLKSYKKIFNDPCGCTKLKIMKSNKIYDRLKINSNTLAIIYQIDKFYLEPYKSDMIIQQNKIEKRRRISEFIGNILFYPLTLITNYFNL